MSPKILIVDDELDMVELIRFNLAAEGYEVVTAGSGLEALNLARAALPDLILLDLMLPEIDGLSVCEILRRLPSTAGIPVIIVTAWSGELGRLVGLDAGAVDYVKKPFSPRELVLRIKRSLQTAEEKALAQLMREELSPGLT